MLPLNLLSRLVMGFAQSGLTVTLDNADESMRSKIQVDMETAALNVLNRLKAEFIESGHNEDQAKTLAMVTVCVSAASVMEVVASAED